MDPQTHRRYLEQLDRSIELGREVYYCLKRAQEKLDKASDWALIDLVTANFLTSTIKHRRIEEANAELENARACLREMSGMLDQTVLPDKISVHVNKVARLADIALGSRLMDIYFQDKVNDSIDEIEKTRGQVKTVVKELKKLRALEDACVSEVDGQEIWEIVPAQKAQT